MTRVHGFAASMKYGAQGEAVLDAYWTAQGYTVEPVDRAMQRLGIDRILQDTNGQRHTVEYKTDMHTHHTGNLFIETVSLNKGKVPGWALTSTAQELHYLIAGNLSLIVLDMLDLRRLLDVFGRLAPMQGEAYNNGYASSGHLLPVRDLLRLAHTARHLKLTGRTDAEALAETAIALTESRKAA